MHRIRRQQGDFHVEQSNIPPTLIPVIDRVIWTTCLIIVALVSKTAETFFSEVPFEGQWLSGL